LQEVKSNDPTLEGEDWKQARPAEIKKALAQTLARPSGGWYVLDDSLRIGKTPSVYWVAGRELVAWRCASGLLVGPNRCPHMGGPLSAGRRQGDDLLCPWHGYRVSCANQGSKAGYKSFVSHDDGVLCWVRLDEEGSAPAEEVNAASASGGRAQATAKPILPTRPATHIAAVTRVIARCAPEDVIANRLDPWHGAHLHPHSFARLIVLEKADEHIDVRVAFRVFGPVCVEVDCRFHCPEPRTIVMTILRGEGAGSIVETHATPMVDGWTAVVEATLASSPREGFEYGVKMTPLLRPLIRAAARRLWSDDGAYAERTHMLRTGRGPDLQLTAGFRRAVGTPHRRPERH
jgi:isorenieratene synthase